MSDQPDETGHEGTDAEAGAQAPSPVLRGYPPEAAPAADDDTAPVMVPGEQTSPARRLDVFPEDDAAPAGGRSGPAGDDGQVEPRD